MIEKSDKRRDDVWIGAFYKVRPERSKYKLVPVTELEWEWVTGEVFSFSKFRDETDKNQSRNEFVYIRNKQWRTWADGSDNGYFICEWDF